MEKFAILALVTGQASAQPSILGRSLVEHLVTGLERSGVRRFLLVGDLPATDAARLVDLIKSKGLGASYHRTLAELDAVLPVEARLVLVAADAWISAETLAFVQQFDKAVLVTEHSGWERLDRDHFWGGVATFGRRAVSDGADLPESWDVASTLLRQLTQDGARRIDSEQASSHAMPVRVANEEGARQIERAAVGGSPSAHWFDRLVTAPIARGVLLLMRRKPAARWPLLHLPLAAALLAAVGGAMGSITWGALAAIMALAGDRALERIDPDRRDHRAVPWRSAAGLGLVAAAGFLLSRRADISIIACAVLVLSAALCADRRFDGRWDMIVPILPVVALILLIASLLAGPMAIGVTSLACLAALVAERWISHRRKRTALKPN